MRGEKVDVNNIGKAVNEEFEDFKKRMKNFGDEMGSRENKDRIRSTAQKAVDFGGDVLYSMLKIAGKIIAIIAVLLGTLLLVGLLATVFGRGTISVFDTPGNPIHFSLYEFSAAVLPNDFPVGLAVTGLILFIGVPLLLIIYRGIKLLFGIKTKNKIVKYTANGLWICSWIILIYIGISIGNDFSEDASAKQTVYVKQPEKMLSLDLNPMPDDDLDVTYHHHRKVHFGDWTMISKDNNQFRLAYPSLDITASETESFQLNIIKSAKGFDKKDATDRARDIDYSVTQTDSTIYFNSFFDVKTSDKLRAQDVRIILKVPVNKMIYLSKRMEKIILGIDNVNDALDDDMVGRRWIMTRQGLQCIDCDGLDNIHPLSPPPAPPAPPTEKY